MGSNKNAASDAAAASNRGIDRQIAELRRQFDITSEDLAPFISAGESAIPAVTEGATLPGLADRLSQIFNTDIFSTLVDERTRSAEGQLAAGGLTRSGAGVSAIADIPTNIGLAIEQMLSGRASNLFNTGVDTASRLGGFGAQAAGQVGQAFAQQGENVASGIIGDAQAGAATFGNILNAGTAILSALPFSDPRLKTNAVKIEQMGPLGVYQWDWIPEAEGTVVEKCPTIGFMADEVAKHYPEFAGEFGGFQYIDYGGLLDHLKTDLKIPEEIIEHGSDVELRQAIAERMGSPYADTR